MTKKQDVIKDILDSINSVKSRARKAQKENNEAALYILMGDLYALQMLLVDEIARMISAGDLSFNESDEENEAA